MLRILINLVLLYFAYRMVRPVVMRGVRYVQRLMGTRPADPKVGNGTYSNLTSYDIEDADIEDADFEEIKQKSD